MVLASYAYCCWRRGRQLTYIAAGTSAMLTTLTNNGAVMKLETRRQQDIHVIVLLLLPNARYTILDTVV